MRAGSAPSDAGAGEMNVMKKVVPALLLALALLPAAAAQRRAGKDPCDDPQSQPEMNLCARERFKAADAARSRAYDRLAAKLEGDPRERLKAAEAAWLRYRDDNCVYEASIYEGGTIKPTVYSSCLERVTKARTAELRLQLRELGW